MVSQNQSSRTARFLDPWPWFSLVAAGSVLYSLLASPWNSKPLLSTQLSISPQSPEATTQPFRLKPSRFGSLQVDVRANIPAGRWLTYEIQLRDAQGKTLAAATRQAWRQSGSWTESDVRGGLTIRAQQSAPLVVAINALDSSDRTGQDVNQPINVSLTIRDGVVDTRYLWPGLLGTVMMTIWAFRATGLSGKRMITKAVADSELSDRAILGGPNALIRIEVSVTGDETRLSLFRITLKIRDGNGQLMEVQKHTAKPKVYRDSDGDIDHTTAELKLFFLLESPGSYGFFVTVEPDEPIEHTELRVFQQARTRLPVDVMTLAKKE